MTLRHVRAGQTRHTPAGMTLVELNVGLLVMTLIGGALAAFTLALGGHWRAGEEAQNVQQVGFVASSRLIEQLSGCRDVLALHAGGDGQLLVLWAADDIEPDDQIQAGELQVLRFSQADQTLWWYARVPEGTLLVAAQQSAMTQTVPRQTAASRTYANSLMSQPYMTERSFAGPGHAAAGQLALLTDCTFTWQQQGQGKPVVSFEMSLRRDDEVADAFGSAALRCWEQP